MTQTELLTFPLDSYPVLYKMHWNEDLDEDKRIENNRTHNSIISTIIESYYNLTFNINSLDEITYVGRENPWCIVFKLVYMNNDGTTDYLWEYLPNWANIVSYCRYPISITADNTVITVDNGVITVDRI